MFRSYSFPQSRALCRLNGLPPSALSTTPHLLHTRRTLKLPPNTKVKDSALFSLSRTANHNAPGRRDDVKHRRDHKDALERATKRLQCVTKETDWRVAQAYIAISTPTTSRIRPTEELTLPDVIANCAAQKYLDDEEWETQEAANGRGPPSITGIGMRMSPSLDLVSRLLSSEKRYIVKEKVAEH